MKYVSLVLSSLLLLYFGLCTARFLFVSDEWEMGAGAAFILTCFCLLYYAVLTSGIYILFIKQGNRKFLGLSFVLILTPVVLLFFFLFRS